MEEKQPLLVSEEPTEIPYHQPVRYSRRRRVVTHLLAIAFVFALVFQINRDTPVFKNIVQDEVPEEYPWDALKFSRDLEYSPCYSGFQCARLELPMDYWNGTTDATIGLAVIKRPAVVPVTDPRYGGMIMFNPGGPGGSGVNLLLSAWTALRSEVEPRLDESADMHDSKFFDLISFDPRGVGESEPPVVCFDNEMLEHIWQVRIMEEGMFGSSNAAFGRLWSMSIARGRSCSLYSHSADIKQYVSTASVATDMIHIAEAHGRWREQEARRLLRQRGPAKLISDVVDMDRLYYKPGAEKIQYWGFSYGTYLGATFAAMYPELVHRVIIDGVVDAYDYKKALWSDNLIDTEKDMDQFYYHCARAGWPACGLANKTRETTEAGVKNKTLSIINSLFHDPLPVIGQFPEVITYSDVRNLVFAALYTPIQAFPFLANVLTELERGDGTEFVKLLRAYRGVSGADAPNSNPHLLAEPLRNKTTRSTMITPDASKAIACSDGDDRSGVDKESFNKFWHEMRKFSPTLGAQWSTISMECIHYNIRANHRFEGPWTAETSHPLLLIGNIADPVTPLAAARNMSKGFKDSVVLQQNSAGHCSISARSKCTSKHIMNYFQTGRLPAEGTTCEPDEIPFGPGKDGVGYVEDQEARDVSLLGSIFEASGAFRGSRIDSGAARAWFGI